MARLANSVVYIYLFSFAEAGFVLGFFLSGFILPSKLIGDLSCLYLEFFHGTLAKIQRAEVIAEVYSQIYVTMPCFELLF